MLYSRSAEYAIRAFVRLAHASDGRFIMARTIAEQEQMPGHFLAKILQEMVRKGLLKSSKGPTGGFALRLPASKIRLLDIVEAADGQTLRDTAQQAPWMLAPWKVLHSRIMEALEQNTVADVAKALDELRAGGERRRRGKRAASRKG